MTGEAAIAPTASVRPADAGERLGSLFDTHHERLYRLARRLSRNADDARDLVQETFLRAARSPGSVPPGAPHEEAWLVRVLINICRDRWRQTANRARLDRLGAAAQPLPPADPESALIARSLVQDALAALTPRRRAILVMYELEGATIPAIAGTLGVTVVTVRWHLSRGRREMASRIRARTGAVTADPDPDGATVPADNEDEACGRPARRALPGGAEAAPGRAPGGVES
jgi:RNA polymerase sigma-70 factor (ECF subfamily)